MTQINTDLGVTRESARLIRFEEIPAIQHTNVQEAIEQVGTSPPGIVPTSVTTTPYTVLATDTYLYVDTSVARTINLQAAAARGGIPLVIKDVTGQAAANNITINPDGSETIDGLDPLTINADFGGYKLAPQSTGYTIIP